LKSLVYYYRVRNEMKCCKMDAAAIGNQQPQHPLCRCFVLQVATLLFCFAV